MPNNENPLRSRVIFVEVEQPIIDLVTSQSGPRLELSSMDSVEKLLTASGLGTLDCEVVILGSGAKEPMRVAQRIQKLDKNIQIVILANADQAEDYQRIIDFSPFLGDAVSLLSIDEREELREFIRRAVKRAHRRCSYRRKDEGSSASGDETAPGSRDVSQYLGNMLDNAPIGVLTLDSNARIQTLNPRGSEILNVRERDVLDTPFQNFFMPVDRIRLDRVLNDGEAYVGHFRISGDTTEARFVEISASDYVSRSGQQGKMIILHDVSERIATEQARIRAAAALQASEDRFMELAEVLRLIPWEADATTQRFTFVGEQAEEITGYPTRQWYQEGFWRELLHPDDRDRTLQVRTSNLRRLQNFDHQYRIVIASGRVLWIHDIVNVVRDDYAKPKKLRGFMVDVTEKNQSAHSHRRHA